MFDFLSWGDYGQLVLSINNVAIVLPKIYIFSETKYPNSCSDIRWFEQRVASNVLRVLLTGVSMLRFLEHFSNKR